MVFIVRDAQPIFTTICQAKHQFTDTQPVFAPITGFIHSLLVTELKYWRELFADTTPFGSTIPTSITWMADAKVLNELRSDV